MEENINILINNLESIIISNTININIIYKYILSFEKNNNLNLNSSINIIEKHEKLKNILKIISEIIEFNSLLVLSYKIITSKIDEEEKEYETVSKSIDSIGLYLNDINYRKLGYEEQTLLFIKMSNGDINAKEKLIMHNLRLVIKIAKEYPHNNNNIMDIIQEGNIGLIKAIEMFDYTKEYSFSTYAAYWIRQGINRNIKYKDDLIRIPESTKIKLNKIKYFVNNFIVKNGYEPTNDDIKNNIKVSDYVIKLYNTFQNNYTYESYDVLNEENSKFLNSIVSNDINLLNISENISNSEIIELIFNSDVLSSKEKKILYLRYGFDKKGFKTLEEVSKYFNVSRQRIKQIELRSFKKIRNIINPQEKENKKQKTLYIKDIIKNIKDGDNKYFENFINYYHSIILEDLNHYGYSINDEDLLQEIYIDIYKRLLTCDTSKHCISIIHSSICDCVKNYTKSNENIISLSIENEKEINKHAIKCDYINENELNEIYLQLLNSDILSDEEKKVLYLYVSYNITQEKISKILNIRNQKVSKILKRIPIKYRIQMG